MPFRVMVSSLCDGGGLGCRRSRTFLGKLITRSCLSRLKEDCEDISNMRRLKRWDNMLSRCIIVILELCSPSRRFRSWIVRVKFNHLQRPAQRAKRHIPIAMWSHIYAMLVHDQREQPCAWTDAMVFCEEWLLEKVKLQKIWPRMRAGGTFCRSSLYVIGLSQEPSSNKNALWIYHDYFTLNCKPFTLGIDPSIYRNIGTSQE